MLFGRGTQISSRVSNRERIDPERFLWLREIEQVSVVQLFMESSLRILSCMQNSYDLDFIRDYAIENYAIPLSQASQIRINVAALRPDTWLIYKHPPPFLQTPYLLLCCRYVIVSDEIVNFG